MVTALPADLQDVARFAYRSGWRKGEVLTLEWGDVSADRRRVTLRREHSKNREPRVLPLTGALAELIEARWRAREVPGPSGTTLIARHVFHHAGQPITDLRKAWRTACKAAGRPGVLFHDLRRSAVRNFDRAGVSQAVAMRLSGHKTVSVYKRYRIIDERDLQEALERTEAAVEQRRQIVATLPTANAARG